jgi:hypothetical protein
MTDDETVATVEYKGHTIKICQDPEMPHPRLDFDNQSKVICFSKKFYIGDKHSFKTPDEALEWLEANTDDIWIWKIYMRNHGGLVLSITSFNDRWDSGHIGWAYILRKDVPDEDIAIATIQNEIQMYNHYLSGSVYGYIIDSDVIQDNNQWGYYGDIDLPIRDAKVVIDDFWFKEAEVDLFMQNCFAL